LNSSEALGGIPDCSSNRGIEVHRECGALQLSLLSLFKQDEYRDKRCHKKEDWRMQNKNKQNVVIQMAKTPDTRERNCMYSCSFKLLLKNMKTG
jgi:hypothetical protein